MTATLIPVLLTLACSSGPAEETDNLETYLETYEALVAEAEELVHGLETDLPVAADLDAAHLLIDDYVAEWGHLDEDWGHLMEDLEGCDMDDDGMSAHMDAETAFEAMHEAVEAFEGIQAGHATLEDCQADGETHAEEMEGLMDGMDAHHDTWHDGETTCMGEAHEDEGHTEEEEEH